MKKTILSLIFILVISQTVYSQTKQSFILGFGYFRDIEFEGNGVGMNLEYSHFLSDGIDAGCDIGLGQFSNNYQYDGQLKYFGLHISFLPIENPNFKLSFSLGPQIANYKSLHLLYEHEQYQNNVLVKHDQLYEYYDNQIWGLNFNIKAMINISKNLDFLLTSGFLKYQDDKNFFIAQIGFGYNL